MAFFSSLSSFQAPVFDVPVQQSIDVPSAQVQVFEAPLRRPNFQQFFDVPSTQVPTEDGVTVEIVTSEHYYLYSCFRVDFVFYAMVIKPNKAH